MTITYGRTGSATLTFHVAKRASTNHIAPEGSKSRGKTRPLPAKVSAKIARKPHKLSAAARAKISAEMKAKHSHRKLSAESRAKISMKLKARKRGKK